MTLSIIISVNFHTIVHHYCYFVSIIFLSAGVCNVRSLHSAIVQYNMRSQWALLYVLLPMDYIWWSLWTKSGMLEVGLACQWKNTDHKKLHYNECI